MYGPHHITLWAAMNKNKTIFDLVTISDMTYMVAVIENGHEFWEQLHETPLYHQVKKGQQRWEREQDDLFTKKTPKFTKKAMKKRQCNTSGWNHEGILFYNKVWDEWKRLASENKEQTWQKLGSEWNNYIEEYNLLYFPGRSRKRKLSDGTDPKDMPSLPTMDVSEIMLVDDEDYQPDCPWKTFDNNNNDKPR
jgi:hypothetical protein